MIPLAILIAGIASAVNTPDNAGHVDTIYDTRHGMVTLVTGDPAQGSVHGAPVLIFFDGGEKVRVYASDAIQINEARDYLQRCRLARAKAEAVRHRIGMKK